MNARLALAWVSLSMLVVACATNTGGGASSPATSSPTTSASTGADSAASGSASSGSSSPGSESPDSKSAGKTGTASTTGTTSTAGAAAAGNSSTERGDGSADPGVAVKTPAERRADIDGKLDASLGHFDEQLRGEQQRTAAERDAKATARADGAAVDATSNRVGEKERDGDKGEIQRDRTGDLQSVGVQGKGTGNSDTADQTGVPGSANQQANGAAGKPIPSGVDDDIVARRLRRAAENETDPELKEKLWKEYRDYKENTQVSK